MIRVRVPSEITEYKAKLFFGLTTRQLLFGILAIALGIGCYFLLLKAGAGADAAGYAIIIIVIPLIAFGFITKDGLPFEKILSIIFKYKESPAERIYKTSGENSYEYYQKTTKSLPKAKESGEYDARVVFGRSEDKRRRKVAKKEAARAAKER